MLGELSQSSTHSSLRVGGARRSRFNFVNLYPVCLRVRPLLARLGDDEIVADFQKILDPLRYGAERTHGGIGGLWTMNRSCRGGAIAHTKGARLWRFCT